MKARRDRRHSERGAVLITVLFIVVVMSTTAVALVDDIRFGIRRATNVTLNDQAFWYALGIEEYARQQIDEYTGTDREKAMLSASGGVRQVQFPIEGGLVTGQLSDGSNCFNLNSVVIRGEEGEAVLNETGLAEYRRLLTALGFDLAEAETLADTLVDWIDDDTAPRPQGAEDYTYATLDPPYRAKNDMLSGPGELRAVKGYTIEVYHRIRDYVCALPLRAGQPLNVNSLTPEQAPLVVMLVGDALRQAEARRIIEDRPRAGYDRIDDFWSHSVFENLDIGEDLRERVATRTTYYILDAEVQYHEEWTRIHSLFEVEQTGYVRVFSRYFGERE